MNPETGGAPSSPVGPEPDPPREPLRFKPREFERLNEPQHAPTGAAGPTTAAEMLDGAPAVPPGGAEPSPRSTQEQPPKSVREILLENAQRDTASGWYRVEALPDRVRRRRHLIYWSTLAAVDTPLGLLAWFSGHADPIPFVLSIAAIAFFTGRLTWLTWFLRTD